MKKKQMQLARLLLFLSLVLIVLHATCRAVPARHIRIAAGPEGGSFYAIALQYKKILERKYYQVEIIPFQNTDEISVKVADDKAHVDIGFVVNDLHGKNTDSLISLGEIQLQPIFIFVKRSEEAAGRIQSFADLRGLRLVLPPEKSVTSQTLLSIFALYGVDRGNTSLSFLPLGSGIPQLLQEKFDAGLFILGADSELMAGLAKNPNLALAELKQQTAIVKKFPFLQEVTLPNGIFDLEGKIPARDMKLLAANISVIAKKDLPAATTYALLEAMRQVHRSSGYVNDENEFPKYSSTAIPASEFVNEFYRKGTPWIYSVFPTAAASILDAYLAPLLGIWCLLSIYRFFIQLEKIRSLTLSFLARLLLCWQRWDIRKGRPLSPLARTLAQKIESAIEREEQGLPELLAELKHIRQP